MSITFFSPEAPTEPREVDDGDGVLVLREVSTLPSLDMGNATAGAVLRTLGLDADSWGGSLSGADMAEPIRKAVLIVNGADVSGYAQEPSESQGAVRVRKDENGISRIERGATLIDCGVPEQRIRRCVGDLLDLMIRARRRGFSVEWG